MSTLNLVTLVLFLPKLTGMVIFKTVVKISLQSHRYAAMAMPLSSHVDVLSVMWELKR
jgi:hypothetical protein